MKTIQKITLALLTVVSVSSLSAAMEVNYLDGAELESAVTGAVKFSGTGNLKFTGSASADAEVFAGNVRIASNNAASFTMNGGSLETTAAVNLLNIVMTQPANIALGGASAFAATGSAKATVSGPHALELRSVVGNLDFSGAATTLNASSDLQGTYNLGAVVLAAPAAAAGNFGTVIASGDVDASAAHIAAGSFDALTIAGKLNIGNKKFSNAITVS
jgi:hypothetical protein